MIAVTEAPTPEAILSAARRLYERGDAGFTDLDAATASGVLRSKRAYSKQVRTLWRLLESYEEVLTGLGVDYRGLVPPPLHSNGRTASTPSAGRPVALKLVETKEGRKVVVRTPFDKELIGVVQGLPSREWDKTGSRSGMPRTWLIPGNPVDIELAINRFGAVKDVALEIDPELRKIVEAGKQTYTESRAESSDFKVPTKLDLYPFQRAGVKWIDDHQGRAFIADSMGLGKTIQSLGWLALRPEKALPALVICPQIVRVHWYREIQHFTDFKPLLIAGKSIAPAFERAGLAVSREPKSGFDILIMNYDLLSVETRKTWLKQLLGHKPELEKYGAKHLALAGHQAVKLLQEAMEKYKEIEKRNRIARVLGEIEDLGKDARKEKAPEYKLVFVNGIPFEDFIGVGFKTLICDESQYVKEQGIQRTDATIAISEKVENAICLTGTPIDNRTRELWTQLKIVQPSLFPSFFDYGRRFCGAFKKNAGKDKKVWDFNGASNTTELEQILRSTVMIRRLKEDVLKELPPKTRTMIPFVIEGEDEEYKAKEERSWKKLRELRKEREEWKALMNTLSDEERKAFLAKHAEKAAKAARLSDLALAEIEEMKQEAVARKLPETVKFVLGLKETQGKILVFVAHHTTVDRLMAIFSGEGIKTSFIDSRVTGTERQAIVDSFQAGDLEILICGIRAASIGLTLTACHTVVFIELEWTPGKHSQAEDRVYRIGQSKPVTIYYLLLLGSIEEKIAKMIDAKREIANSVLGEGEKSVTEAGILDAVLDGLLED